MKRYNNDMATSGVTAGILIFIIVVVGVLSFLMISSEFDNQYTAASIDKANSTGILLNNTSAYIGVKTITKSFADSAPAAIFLAILIVITVIVLAVWAILKRGD